MCWLWFEFYAEHLRITRHDEVDVVAKDSSIVMAKDSSVMAKDSSVVMKNNPSVMAKDSL